MTKLFDQKWKLFVSGAVFGLLAMLLAILGNPGNMAICIACFVRDMAGAMKLHSAEAVQYFRPEIVGCILGSFLISVTTKEYKATAGSIRDLALLKDASLISVLDGLFIVMLVYNIASGNFHLSFSRQPIAHSQHLWNILGLYVVGFSAVAGDPGIYGKVAVILCIIVLFIIACTQKRKTAK